MTEFSHPTPHGLIMGFGLFADKPLDVDALQVALVQKFGDAVSRDIAGGGDTGKPRTPTLWIRTKNVTVLVAPVGEPIANGEAVRACHPVWWRDTTAVETHRSHVVISTAPADPEGERDHAAALSEAVTFSEVASIILERPGAVGIYYASAGITFPSGPYVQTIRESLEADQLPTDVWVSVWILHDMQGRVGGYTMGLDTFGHADLIIEHSEHSTTDVYRTLVQLATWLIVSGEHLTPGEAVGFSKERQFPVSARPAEPHGQQLLQVDF